MCGIGEVGVADYSTSKRDMRRPAGEPISGAVLIGFHPSRIADTISYEYRRHPPFLCAVPF
jgi:hypothetical protein